MIQCCVDPVEWRPPPYDVAVQCVKLQLVSCASDEEVMKSPPPFEDDEHFVKSVSFTLTLSFVSTNNPPPPCALLLFDVQLWKEHFASVRVLVLAYESPPPL